MFAGILPNDWSNVVEGDSSALREDEKFQTLAGSTGEEKLKNFVVNNLGVITKYILIAVAILFLMISAVELVLNAGNEENITNAKKNIGWSLLAFAVIGLAGKASEALDPSTNTTSETILKPDLVNTTLQYPINFLALSAGIIAFLFLAFSAVKMITAQGDETIIGEQKEHILWSFVGLVIILLADSVVRNIFRPTKTVVGQGEASLVLQEVVGVINFITIFAAIGAVGAFVVGGIMYVSSFGNDEATDKAKSLMKSAAIGLVIVLMSYTFVSVFVQ